MSDRDPLRPYRGMRDFHATQEPRGDVAPPSSAALGFVVQRHAASHLHFDLRLELDGVLKSWAVPKGPSLVPGEKRLAVEVEDHPLAYGAFEGAIPRGQYGGGYVFVWDSGSWTPVGDPRRGLAKGHLSFELHGGKLRGRFALVRTRGRAEKPTWLLLKADDRHAAKAGGRPVTDARAPPPLRSFPPELATLTDAIPRGDDWIVEPKLDGYRALASVHGDTVHVASRSGQSFTARFPAIRAALAALRVSSAVFDGEICALDDGGFPRFEALQAALSARPRDRDGLVYFVFDLLFVDGEDLRERPLAVRKAILGSVLEGVGAPLAYVGDAPRSKADGLLSAARAHGMEGLVAKRPDSPYRAGRGKDWLKVKVTRRQEMVVVGTSPGRASRGPIGALLVAVRDRGGLRYAGKVGTGFSAATLARLEARLSPLTVAAPAARGVAKQRGVRWVRPEVVVEVRFAEWTRAGRVRHASFVGLRDDKPATEIVREDPAPRASGGRRAHR